MSENSDSAFISGMKRAEYFVVEYGPTLLVAIAGIGWTVFRTWILEPPQEASGWRVTASWALGGALSLAGAAGAVLTYRRSGSIKQLKSEKDGADREIDSLKDTLLRLSANSRDAWKNRLANIFQDLGLNHNFRISLYRFNPDTNTFSMLGRYASIERLKRVGRGVYPADVGCIGEAWESPDLEAYADDLPEAQEEYIAETCDRWNFAEDTVRNLNMKSRSVYAFTLMNALGQDRTAVLVFESIDRHAGDVAALRQAAQVTYRNQILSDLDSLEFIEPEPKVASDAGF